MRFICVGDGELAVRWNENVSSVADLLNTTIQPLLDAWGLVEHVKLSIPHKEVNVKKNESNSTDIDQLPIDRYEGIAHGGGGGVKRGGEVSGL